MRKIKLLSNAKNAIKNIFNKNPTISGVKLVIDENNGFYSWDGELYHSDIVRSCISPKARAIGKLAPKHIRKNENELKVNPEIHIKMLLEEPNPYMSGQMLQEKLTNQLELNNNAFAFIVRDEFGIANQIYPIIARVVKARYDEENELFLQFTLKNGNIVEFPYRDIIHLRQDFNENDIFGTPKINALKPLMEVVTTTDQGIVKAVKNGGVIRWLLKFNQQLRPEDLKKNTKAFVENYLNQDNDDTGVAAAADAKYDAKQVEPKDYVPNALILDKTFQRIYRLFGTNEKIITSSYTEDEWVSYYESQIEPVVIQLSNEYSRKLFSRKQRAFGNSIIFEAAGLQYASMTTKLNLMQMVDRGALTGNEWREVFNFAPKEGADKLVRRLDTAPVNKISGVKFLNLNKDFINKKKEIYAIDFDGTLCTNKYPEIGEEKAEVIDYVKNLKNEGHKLILWTCREREKLDDAIEWCKEKGIEFDAINENLDETIEQFDSDPRKVSANHYLDDKNLTLNDI
ncbi:phage portal protein [Clostridium perfringens]|uniref:phage portal protein n=1 Tax=Clostridium perfringens TaxID=1502 RepID=UPI002ED5979C|nr:phage portal protein [Clostridium perfringens]